MSYLSQKVPNLVDQDIINNLIKSTPVPEKIDYLSILYDNIYIIVGIFIVCYLYYLHWCYKNKKNNYTVDDIIKKHPLRKIIKIKTPNNKINEDIRNINLATYQPSSNQPVITEYQLPRECDRYYENKIENIYGQPMYKYFEDENYVDNMPIIKNDVVLPCSSRPIIDEYY